MFSRSRSSSKTRVSASTSEGCKTDAVPAQNPDGTSKHFPFRIRSTSLISDPDQLFHHFDCVFAQFLHAFQHDRWFRAHRRVDLLERSLEHVVTRLEQHPSIQDADFDAAGLAWIEARVMLQELRQRQHWFLAHHAVQETRARVADARNLVELTLCPDGWNLIGKRNGVTTHYRHEPETAAHSFRLEGTIAVSILQLLAVTYETDLFCEWFPMITHSTEVAKLSRYTKIVHLKGNVPIINNRDSVAVGYGVDSMDDDGVSLVVVKSIAQHPDVELPPIESGCVRMEVKYAGFIMRPLDAHRTKLDPKIWFIPTFFVNWATGQLAYYFWALLARQAARIGSGEADNEYDRRIAENREVYQDLEERMVAPFSGTAPKYGAHGLLAEQGDDEVYQQDEIPAEWMPKANRKSTKLS